MKTTGIGRFCGSGGSGGSGTHTEGQLAEKSRRVGQTKIRCFLLAFRPSPGSTISTSHPIMSVVHVHNVEEYKNLTATADKLVRGRRKTRLVPGNSFGWANADVSLVSAPLFRLLSTSLPPGTSCEGTKTSSIATWMLVLELQKLSVQISDLNGVANRHFLLLCVPYRCGPCKKIAPTYEALAAKHANALFLHVDVDELVRHLRYPTSSSPYCPRSGLIV